ncbi:hypothetical protein CLF_104607 [Clonorchis sinensis]|uniref:Uncharacterized protein n=1 Tax=Clonorchis sinensis TaxID=79923 RepID=G7YC05_CLOSI|nr:hypothetical protein CLF_104607 [Clonorchis sinensis]
MNIAVKFGGNEGDTGEEYDGGDGSDQHDDHNHEKDKMQMIASEYERRKSKEKLAKASRFPRKAISAQLREGKERSRGSQAVTWKRSMKLLPLSSTVLLIAAPMDEHPEGETAMQLAAFNGIEATGIVKEIRTPYEFVSKKKQNSNLVVFYPAISSGDIVECEPFGCLPSPDDFTQIPESVGEQQIVAGAWNRVLIRSIIIIDSMISVFNTDASLPYNHDLFESLIVGKRIKVDGEGTSCYLTTIIPRCLHLHTLIQPIDSGAFTQLAPPMSSYLPHLPKSSADEPVAATTTVRQVHGFLQLMMMMRFHNRHYFGFTVFSSFSGECEVFPARLSQNRSRYILQ